MKTRPFRLKTQEHDAQYEPGAVVLIRASPENALFPRSHTLQDKAFQTFRKENCFWECYYDFESKNR